jgi:hypothetical protein
MDVMIDVNLAEPTRTPQSPTLNQDAKEIS